MLKICYRNMLEGPSTVSLATGIEDAAYPLWRLFDRDIGRFFQAASTVTLTVKIDQGSQGLIPDTLIIPAGHNLSGMTMDLKHSDNDISYTPDVAQWVQGDNNQLIKSWTPGASHGYQKLIITSPSSAPRFAEMFLSPSLSLAVDPDFGWGKGKESNTLKTQMSTGRSRAVVMGIDRQTRDYKFGLLTQDEASALVTFRDYVGLNRYFYVYDLDGNWYFMELLEMFELINIAPGCWSAAIKLREVIA